MAQIKIIRKNTEYHTKEAYRTIRTNLRLCGSDRKVVAVTSCLPGEGKSRVSIQLAQALSEDGSRVIIIDADLRKSGMLNNISLKAKCQGLSDYLSGQCRAEEIICTTDMEKLDAIISGPFPPNPTELFRTDHFAELIRKLREQYDYVLIDTPPLGSVIDTAVIAEQCDGIIWVISYGLISRGLALEIKSQMDLCKCPVLGAVLNKVELKNSGYYGRYYGKYYGEYYGGVQSEETGEKRNRRARSRRRKR
ncbi:MAG TPA: CpsD/CapB family tyrosine-protein kinase [Candidatus Mediterraneibacter stercoripullorum]|nr:CpsD/CapB family tyrosine-protein kinase [Candidatus Mediterraneibacter stercoripullorum]